MRVPMPIWLPLATALLLLLPACGDDEPSASDSGDWSPPGESGVLSETDLLKAFASHLDDESFDAEAWNQDAHRVAEALWPLEEGGQPPAAARTHLAMSLIAGEVARWIATSPDARAEREKTDPIDIEIHDAFAANVAKSPSHYRVWCETDGKALLEKLEEDRRKRLFGDK